MLDDKNNMPPPGNSKKFSVIILFIRVLTDNSKIPSSP
jgi:hypothetical protein